MTDLTQESALALTKKIDAVSGDIASQALRPLAAYPAELRRIVLNAVIRKLMAANDA